jgi:hypothetical protein
MSWFDIFGGRVIFGGVRLCDTSLDWQFACNIVGPSYCETFPDSTCGFGPSNVFSSFYCASNTTTALDFSNGCPGHEKYFMDYKFRQSNFTEGPRVNVSVIATFNCDEVVMEHNGTGLFVTVLDNTSKSGCPGFVASSTTASSSSTSSISFSNSTTSSSVLTSTVLTTETYTITSCPPTVTNCPVGSLTTRVLTSYTTYCPATVGATTTPSPSCTGGTVSPTSNATSNYLSQSYKPTLSTPTPSPSTVQASSGSSIRVPRIMVWFYSTMLLLFFIPSFVGAFQSNEQSFSSPNIVKRIPVGDMSDIKSFGSTLSATIESNLPTISGKSSSLLQSRIVDATNILCQAGLLNRGLYGPNWTTIPKLLGYRLADCAKSMDQMDQDLLLFYTQDEINAGPEGVLFLKFAGIAYCNRLIAALVNDATSLDGICTLAAS